MAPFEFNYGTGIVRFVHFFNYPEGVTVEDGEQWYLLRTALQGVAGKVLQATGVAIPPSVRPAENVVPTD